MGIFARDADDVFRPEIKNLDAVVLHDLGGRQGQGAAVEILNHAATELLPAHEGLEQHEVLAVDRRE